MGQVLLTTIGYRNSLFMSRFPVDTDIILRSPDLGWIEKDFSPTAGNRPGWLLCNARYRRNHRP
jgi:hypothetical protein